MRKHNIAALAAVLVLSFGLTGCSAVTSYMESAQDKIDEVAAFADNDITVATELAGTDELNDAAAAQCLPVLQEWLTDLKTKADLYKKVKGAVSASVYKHWAQSQIDQGIPANVTLACSAMWTEQKGDFTSAISNVKTLLGK